MATEKDLHPMVTVIMPVRNEARFIRRSLGAVLDQAYPADRMEIFVVDGMSDDGTLELVEELAAASPDHVVRILSNPERVVPKALNLALARASGDVIVRVDGHCEIASDYVRQCIEILQTTGADNVGGVQRATGGTAVEQAIAAATSSPFGVGNASFRYATSPRWTDTVYLGAYKREVFERVGVFDERFVRDQDDEFNIRLSKAGGRIWLDPSLRVVYRPRASIRSLWRQYLEYGEYKVLVIRKHGFTSWRHFVPAALVSSLLGTAVVAVVSRRLSPLALAAGVYVGANTIAGAFVGLRKHVSMPLITVSFAAMHLGYGVGFLRGLATWLRSGRRVGVPQ